MQHLTSSPYPLFGDVGSVQLRQQQQQLQRQQQQVSSGMIPTSMALSPSTMILSVNTNGSVSHVSLPPGSTILAVHQHHHGLSPNVMISSSATMPPQQPTYMSNLESMMHHQQQQQSPPPPYSERNMVVSSKPLISSPPSQRITPPYSPRESTVTLNNILGNPYNNTSPVLTWKPHSPPQTPMRRLQKLESAQDARVNDHSHNHNHTSNNSNYASRTHSADTTRHNSPKRSITPQSPKVASSTHSSPSHGNSSKTKSPALYKTEICRSFEENGGRCKYGNKCQFAHGLNELRPLDRHPRYKTSRCKTFWETGNCPYGKRCCFIHTTRDVEDKATKSIVLRAPEPQRSPSPSRHPRRRTQSSDDHAAMNARIQKALSESSSASSEHNEETWSPSSSSAGGNTPMLNNEGFEPGVVGTYFGNNSTNTNNNNNSVSSNINNDISRDGSTFPSSSSSSGISTTYEMSDAMSLPSFDFSGAFGDSSSGRRRLRAVTAPDLLLLPNGRARRTRSETVDVGVLTWDDALADLSEKVAASCVDD
ncbi:hypothetical protein SmJEL517_g03618 [Synchytrium microbalum]|uniref:C3H1-type domain-containing protein n=1 Tax=Synchytrium microbalum TaxID=1806994 RepID=A0A507C7K0_9FUNG|nr:uncharacterized protein SmJEL517_g03618 [Synchytrium microbalum]TPX33465.1 hypothetical protein SmJEL517_g03618 [Synchytrium microbalum]